MRIETGLKSMLTDVNLYNAPDKRLESISTNNGFLNTPVL